jgi:hypothetical protein
MPKHTKRLAARPDEVLKEAGSVGDADSIVLDVGGH